MKGLKREREEIDKKIETLAKQRRDQLIGGNATKVVIVKGDKRVIIPRSQLVQILKEETNDITIITDPKSLHESDLADESHEPSCYKCGKQGIRLWRKSIFFDWYNNPDILCISCIAPHVVLSWTEIRETLSGSSWHPAILNSDGTRFEAVTTIRGSQYMKEKFLALPK